MLTNSPPEQAGFPPQPSSLHHLIPAIIPRNSPDSQTPNISRENSITPRNPMKTIIKLPKPFFPSYIMDLGTLASPKSAALQRHTQGNHTFPDRSLKTEYLIGRRMPASFSSRPARAFAGPRPSGLPGQLRFLPVNFAKLAHQRVNPAMGDPIHRTRLSAPKRPEFQTNPVP